ncbi:MAG TPA: aminopeptidase N [Pseudomonadales bacterium]
MDTQETPLTVRLTDYRPPTHRIVRTDLTVEIGDGQTRVENRMRIQGEGRADRVYLNGQELELESVAVDGRVLGSNEYQWTPAGLTLFDLPPDCEVTIVNRIHPETNTALEGLYRSRSMYCTQCEAEGFRKITYYQDRPDVLAVFTTTIIADAAYPILLSNGNPVASETLADGRRKVTWHDPFPKPSYLFALVVGDLALNEDAFTTASGRQVTLRIYSEPHNIGQTDYAMDALKRAMRWDESAYGREYDLDIYMIVAVDDFNMGAMENKGLNIFNTSCVLATRDTATDQAYQRVEAVVAHEYFHNWSGNRVTCRDWFQLSLKEGFTVFRDAQFSGAMHSPTVKRIEDVSLLRAVQFAEDAGPLAHPVRPASYMEISNFYTPTVYEKGAEVVRMVHTIVGAERFRAGADLYFGRHDGQAVTTEDFLAAMAEASGRDFGQFQRWYDQAGTPVLTVQAEPLADGFRLQIAQHCPPTPGQPDKAPLHVPIAIGLLDVDGRPLVDPSLAIETRAEVEVRGDTLLVHLKEPEAELHFPGLEGAPAVSFLREFSAPVKVRFERTPAALAFLAEHDTDGFASWDALQTLLVLEVERAADTGEVSAEVLGLFGRMLDRLAEGEQTDAEANMLMSTKLALPSENYLFEQVERIDVEKLCRGRDTLLDALAGAHRQGWLRLLEACDDGSAYSPDAVAMSRRSLKGRALSYLVRGLDLDAVDALLTTRFEAADNLTDRRALLAAALDAAPARSVSERLLVAFYDRWQGEALAVNQWFLLQATSRHCDVAMLERMVAHPAFELTNPNKVRSVLTAFAGTNQRNFHAPDGSGYRYIGERILELDRLNPQMAAGLAKPLTRWRRYTAARGQQMQAVLKRIADEERLSPDLYEIVAKSL